MVSPYLCADSDRENLNSLAPRYSAETRLIGKIGCDLAIVYLHRAREYHNICSISNKPNWVCIEMRDPKSFVRSPVILLIQTIPYFWTMHTSEKLSPYRIYQGSEFAFWIWEQMQTVREQLANRCLPVLREPHCCLRNLVVRQVIREQFANKPSLLCLGISTKLAYFGGFFDKGPVF